MLPVELHTPTDKLELTSTIKATENRKHLKEANVVSLISQQEKKSPE